MGEEHRERREPGDEAHQGEADRGADHVLLRDPHLDEPVRIRPCEHVGAGGGGEVGVEDQQVRLLRGQLDERVRPDVAQRPGSWPRPSPSSVRAASTSSAVATRLCQSETPSVTLKPRPFTVRARIAVGTRRRPAPTGRPRRRRRSGVEVVAVDLQDAPAEGLERRPDGAPAHGSRRSPRFVSPGREGPAVLLHPVPIDDRGEVPEAVLAAPRWTASQTWPSWISPSPSRTQVWASRPRRRAPIAMPTPIEMPCPSEPVDASRPGSRVMSGWPWSRVPRRRRSRAPPPGSSPAAPSPRTARSPSGPWTG